MREDVNQVINENKDFFRGRFDVTESLQGRFYFIEYAAKNDEYMSFCEFDTAEQLREMIQSITGDIDSWKSEDNDLASIISDLKTLNKSLSETIEKLDKSYNV